jgi:riboflavin kinase / FMN adenylyltransferase
VTLRLFRHFNSTIPQNHVWIIGNFDGLHKGHCHLIDTALNIAGSSNKKVGLLSFHPHPRQFFDSIHKSINIMQFSEKVRLLQEMQIDYYYLHPFNQKLANMAALDFCIKIKTQMNPSDIIVGHDFHFGKGRIGTPAMLAEFCQKNQINCIIIPPTVTASGERYSSESLRNFLTDGNIPAVTSFLLHDYILSGYVTHGKHLAQKLGFPTANIPLKNLFLPKFGVYRCRVVNMDNTLAIANIGIKPTLNNGNSVPVLEVHIPNFNGNLYGKKLRIAFDRFIRPEIKFASLDALKAQIEKDVRNLS